ncbi:tetratricopeptide repeat protein [uncultured Thiodictyon sp.]|jgi:Flp pilus assembly protein TadD|uniref:tetratricopeptide repeat protein n=1 Tax=uncultured Thiodictyon sp. TaxID=1846217 RepID=UPI0025D83C09|nr:tetratricopeptide repeat protein [uncultured Thiodictyon sp.]
MPKLTPLHWLLAAVFLAFYGFAVFAVTRDYYVRHPVRPPAARGGGAAPAGHPATRAPGAAPRSGSDAVPAALTETDADLLRRRADALFSEGRYRETLPVYRRILELAPEDLETRNDLGLALYYTGDASGALEQLRTATAADPRFQRGWLTLGYVTLESGDKPKAREALGRARDLGPDNPLGQEAVRLLGVAKD